MILSGPHERLITNNNPQCRKGVPGSLLAQKKFLLALRCKNRKTGDRTVANHNLLLPEELPNLFSASGFVCGGKE
jgi:hypothetical protein